MLTNEATLETHNYLFYLVQNYAKNKKIFIFHIPFSLRKILVKFPKKSHFNSKFALVEYFLAF
jgi:hypothetical protein